MAMDTDYNATYAITDVINNNAKVDGTAVDNTGMSQGALYNQLSSIVTNWNLTMTKLEADDATTTTYTPDNAYTTLATQGNGLSVKGMHQVDLYNKLADIATKFNAVLALLDADGGITKDNYTTTVNALGTAAALALNAKVSGTGIGQQDIVDFLDDYITKYNGLLAHLDTDGS